LLPDKRFTTLNGPRSTGAVDEPQLDRIARENDIIKDIPEEPRARHGSPQGRGDQGHGTFAGPHHVRVGDRTVRASHIVIAAGSKPRRCRFPAPST
jgi:pyruvate/2-oxoglutarate dehydrogenase complex dihydrolipoamide dehydrogenase (E3) component